MSSVEDDGAIADGAAMIDFSRYRARRVREQLIALLDQLHVAIERRDVYRVQAVLDTAEKYRCLPAGVREEAIEMAQLPPTSLRAPMRLYRYQHLLWRLADEPMDTALDPAQLAMDFTPLAGPSPVGSPASTTTSLGRELAFRDRRSPNDGPRPGGGDRRRSGSR